MAMERKNGNVATAEGVAQPRAEWIERRREEAGRTGDPNLSQMHFARQGTVTGADEVFVLDNKDVPGDETSLFVPLLRDREMQPYTVPKRTSQSVFARYH